MSAPHSFRSGMVMLPPLNTRGLRVCQNSAARNLEASLKADRPRTLVQMATGAGTTVTAIRQGYHLLKHAPACRGLFLVDTRNLDEQELPAFIPDDDNRTFPELDNVQRLISPSVVGDSQVVTSTSPRMYAPLEGEELADGAEDENPAEQTWYPKEPIPVVPNPALPPKSFDGVVVDKGPRSLDNL